MWCILLKQAVDVHLLRQADLTMVTIMFNADTQDPIQLQLENDLKFCLQRIRESRAYLIIVITQNHIVNPNHDDQLW